MQLAFLDFSSIFKWVLQFWAVIFSTSSSRVHEEEIDRIPWASDK